MVEDNGIGYLEGCATKYVTRWRNKHGLEDLDKAKHYVEKLLEKHDEPANRRFRGCVPSEAMAEYVQANNLDPEGHEAEVIYLLTGAWERVDLLRALEHIDRLEEWAKSSAADLGICPCEEGG